MQTFHAVGGFASSVKLDTGNSVEQQLAEMLLLILLGLLSFVPMGAATCAVSSGCDQCVNSGCTWVISSALQPRCLSVEDYGNIKVKLSFRSLKACKRFPIVYGQLMAVGVQEDGTASRNPPSIIATPAVSHHPLPRPPALTASRNPPLIVAAPVVSQHPIPWTPAPPASQIPRSVLPRSNYTYGIKPNTPSPIPNAIKRREPSMHNPFKIPDLRSPLEPIVPRISPGLVSPPLPSPPKVFRPYAPPPRPSPLSPPRTSPPRVAAVESPPSRRPTSTRLQTNQRLQNAGPTRPPVSHPSRTGDPRRPEDLRRVKAAPVLRGIFQGEPRLPPPPDTMASVVSSSAVPLTTSSKVLPLFMRESTPTFTIFTTREVSQASTTILPEVIQTTLTQSSTPYTTARPTEIGSSTTEMLQETTVMFPEITATASTSTARPSSTSTPLLTTPTVTMGISQEPTTFLPSTTISASTTARNDLLTTTPSFGTTSSTLPSTKETRMIRARAGNPDDTTQMRMQHVCRGFKKNLQTRWMLSVCRTMELSRQRAMREVGDSLFLWVMRNPLLDTRTCFLVNYRNRHCGKSQ